MMRRAGLAAVGAWLLLMAAGPAWPAASGGTHNEYYRMQEYDPALPVATVQLDRVLFALTTVAGRYRILVLKLEARPDRPDLALSRSDDRLTLLVEGREVPALLDPATADPALWDGLDPTLRQALLYPAALEAGSVRLLYLLVPAAEVAAAPSGFRLFIASLGRSLELTRTAPQAE